MISIIQFMNELVLCILRRVLVSQYDVFSMNKLSPKTFRSLIELVHLLISHQTTFIQSTVNYIKHLSSKLLFILS